MKKYFIFLSITICAIAIVFSNCNKETCLGKKHKHYISPIMKDYFGVYLQNGRKWIYENNTKTKTSILEIYYVSEIHYQKQEPCELYEVYQIHFSDVPFLKSPGKFYFEKTTLSNSGITDIFYNDDFNIQFSDQSNSFANASYMDSISIKGKTYCNILKYSKENKNFYFHKNFGLIKLESLTDTFYIKSD